MTTESTPPAAQRSRVSRVLHILLYIYAAVTVIPLSILTIALILAYTVFDTTVKIHPNYSISLTRGDGELGHHYYLGSTAPTWESEVGLQGIALDGEGVYVLYHANEYYRIALDGTERVRLKQLPAYIKLEDPATFWQQRQREQ